MRLLKMLNFEFRIKISHTNDASQTDQSKVFIPRSVQFPFSDDMDEAFGITIPDD